MQYKYIISTIALSFFLIGTNIQAQVTFGSINAPEDFATLQIESEDRVGGISLPKVTDVEKNNVAWKAVLQASDASAGLVVFNTTTNVIEYWDGNIWIELTGDIDAINGLSNISDNVLKLGGKLTKPITTINQDNSSFNIQNSSSLGGKLLFNAIDDSGNIEITPLAIDDGIVKINPKESFSVNNTALNIKTAETNITSPNFNININQDGGISSSKLSVNPNSVAMDDLYYKHDDSLPEGDPLDYSGYLLTANSQGNTSWEPLRPLGAVITGSLNDNKRITNDPVDITKERINLPSGQWLVFALFNTETQIPGNGVAMYNWANLCSKPSDDPTAVKKAERLGAANPEPKDPNMTGFATPTFSHYINVTEPTELWVEALSSNNQFLLNTTRPESGPLGPSYFFAVRLDIPID